MTDATLAPITLADAQRGVAELQRMLLEKIEWFELAFPGCEISAVELYQDRPLNKRNGKTVAVRVEARL